MLPSSGEIADPCPVPLPLSVTTPSSSTPALSHFLIRRMMRGSPTRCSTKRISQSRLTSSKNEGCRRPVSSSPSSCRSPPTGRRARLALRVRAGIRTRTRGSPPREKRVQHCDCRSLDDPRVEPEDKPCLRERRSRAVAVVHPALGCTLAGWAAPGTLLGGAVRAGPRGCARGSHRTPSMSGHPRPQRRKASPSRSMVRWWKSAMNCSSFLCLAACRMRSSACNTLPQSCARRVLCRTAFPSASTLGSPDSEAHRCASFAGFPATHGGV